MTYKSEHVVQVRRPLLLFVHSGQFRKEFFGSEWITTPCIIFASRPSYIHRLEAELDG